MMLIGTSNVIGASAIPPNIVPQARAALDRLETIRHWRWKCERTLCSDPSVTAALARSLVSHLTSRIPDQRAQRWSQLRREGVVRALMPNRTAALSLDPQVARLAGALDRELQDMLASMNEVPADDQWADIVRTATLQYEAQRQERAAAALLAALDTRVLAVLGVSPPDVRLLKAVGALDGSTEEEARGRAVARALLDSLRVRVTASPEWKRAEVAYAQWRGMLENGFALNPAARAAKRPHVVARVVRSAAAVESADRFSVELVITDGVRTVPMGIVVDDVAFITDGTVARLVLPTKTLAATVRITEAELSNALNTLGVPAVLSKQSPVVRLDGDLSRLVVNLNPRLEDMAAPLRLDLPIGEMLASAGSMEPVALSQAAGGVRARLQQQLLSVVGAPSFTAKVAGRSVTISQVSAVGDWSSEIAFGATWRIADLGDVRIRLQLTAFGTRLRFVPQAHAIPTAMLDPWASRLRATLAQRLRAWAPKGALDLMREHALDAQLTALAGALRLESLTFDGGSQLYSGRVVIEGLGRPIAIALRFAPSDSLPDPFALAEAALRHAIETNLEAVLRRSIVRQVEAVAAAGIAGKRFAPFGPRWQWEVLADPAPRADEKRGGVLVAVRVRFGSTTRTISDVRVLGFDGTTIRGRVDLSAARISPGTVADILRDLLADLGISAAGGKPLIEISDARALQDTFAFRAKLNLPGLPASGLSLGEYRLTDNVAEALPRELTASLLQELGRLPDGFLRVEGVGALRDLEVLARETNIFAANGPVRITFRASAEFHLFDNIPLRMRVTLSPGGVSVQADEDLGRWASGILSKILPSLNASNDILSVEAEWPRNLASVKPLEIAFPLRVVLFGVGQKFDVRITQSQVHIELRPTIPIPAPIAIGPFIARGGTITVDLEKWALALDTQIAFGATHEAARIDATMTVDVPAKIASLHGDLILLNTLRAISTYGKLDIPHGTFDGKAETVDFLKSIVDASQTVHMNAPERTFTTGMSFHGLGLEVAGSMRIVADSNPSIRLQGEGSFLGVRPAVAVEVKLPSEFRAEAQVSVAGLVNGSLSVDQAVVQFKFGVGDLFEVELIAETLQQIDEDLIRRIIEELLRPELDIDALMEMLEKRKITISLLRDSGSSGSRASKRGAANNAIDPERTGGATNTAPATQGNQGDGEAAGAQGGQLVEIPAESGGATGGAQGGAGGYSEVRSYAVGDAIYRFFRVNGSPGWVLNIVRRNEVVFARNVSDEVKNRLTADLLLTRNDDRAITADRTNRVLYSLPLAIDGVAAPIHRFPIPHWEAATGLDFWGELARWPAEGTAFTKRDRGFLELLAEREHSLQVERVELRAGTGEPLNRPPGYFIFAYGENPCRTIDFFSRVDEPEQDVDPSTTLTDYGECDTFATAEVGFLATETMTLSSGTDVQSVALLDAILSAVLAHDTDGLEETYREGTTLLMRREWSIAAVVPGRSWHLTSVMPHDRFSEQGRDDCLASRAGAGAIVALLADDESPWKRMSFHQENGRCRAIVAMTDLDADEWRATGLLSDGSSLVRFGVVNGAALERTFRDWAARRIYVGSFRPRFSSPLRAVERARLIFTVFDAGSQWRESFRANPLGLIGLTTSAR
jgi:hypothetical protein